MKGILRSPQTIRSIFSWVSSRKANKAWIRNCNIVAKRAVVEIQKSSHSQPLEFFQACKTRDVRVETEAMMKRQEEANEREGSFETKGRK